MAHRGADGDLGKMANQLARWQSRAEYESVFGFFSFVLVDGGRQKFRDRLGRAVDESLDHFLNQGKLEDVKQLFHNSRFFRTLVFNSMMSLTKSFFQLTAYMKEDKEFGMFWELIFNEYSLTKKLLLEVSDFKSLMENEAAGKASIKAREEIVQPLLTIQQYALMELQKLKNTKNPDQKQMEVMETMITRSLFGNINASRNSA